MCCVESLLSSPQLWLHFHLFFVESHAVKAEGIETKKLRPFYVDGQLVFAETYRQWSRNKKTIHAKYSGRIRHWDFVGLVPWSTVGKVNLGIRFFVQRTSACYLDAVLKKKQVNLSIFVLCCWGAKEKPWKCKACFSTESTLFFARPRWRLCDFDFLDLDTKWKISVLVLACNLPSDVFRFLQI